MKNYRISNKKRLKAIIDYFEQNYSDKKIALNFNSDFQLLVAVILSAQCTDKRVNKTTPALFKKYPTAKEFASAKQADIEKLIFSTGFYKNKAKNIKGASLLIMNEFNGDLPRTMKSLLKLPGVARKTANVVLSAAFKINDGIVVDTHVLRVSGRLGLCLQKSSKTKNAIKVEKELMKTIPKKYWGKISLWMIFHGRTICNSRKPQCQSCKMSELCPSSLI